MADERLAPFETWKKVTREGPRKANRSPLITLRSSGDIGFGVDFIRAAKIETCTRVSFFLSTDGLRLAMRFHNDETQDDSFFMCRDGGNPGARKRYIGRTVQIGALRSQSPIIASLAKESLAARRLEPKRNAEGLWVVALSPCFENVFDGSRKNLAGASGIYRYRLGEDTVYIGRGNLVERMAACDRREWQFERIEYSIINDDALERKWEAFWLNEYRERTHRWPVYNRIGGVRGPVTISGIITSPSSSVEVSDARCGEFDNGLITFTASDSSAR